MHVLRKAHTHSTCLKWFPKVTFETVLTLVWLVTISHPFKVDHQALPFLWLFSSTKPTVWLWCPWIYIRGRDSAVGRALEWKSSLNTDVFFSPESTFSADSLMMFVQTLCASHASTSALIILTHNYTYNIFTEWKNSRPLTFNTVHFDAISSQCWWENNTEKRWG